MVDDSQGLGMALRAERRRRHLSLRDLADEIDVSFNTLSRVERGFLPDLKNYERITRWLGVETPSLAEADPDRTPLAISRHLFADSRLGPAAAAKIAQAVQEMYDKLAAPAPALSVHLRSAQTFLPTVGPLLADALKEMHERLLEETR
jgi:transcriptional regulator with XRE-family HTH domain